MSTIPDQYKGAGYGTIYGDPELRQAIADAEVAVLIGGSSTPGGGGGDASAANQQSQIALETAIRNRISNGAVIDDRLVAIAQSLVSLLQELQTKTEPTDTQAIAGTVTIGNSSLEISNDAGNPVSISAASLPLPTGAAQEHTIATSPNSARLTDGTSFYKATTPSDTQPISAASLPLPSGAATAAGQNTGNTNLASIDGKIPASPSQEHTTSASPHSARLSDGASFYKATTPSDTQPVSAVSLPLPSGASQDRTTAIAPNSARLTDGTSFYKATTPTDTQPISAVSLPLPTGAAQEHITAASPHAARLSDGTVFYKATTPGDTQPISAASLPLPTGAAQEHTTPTSPNSARLTDGTNFYKATTPADTQPISAASLPLPTGASQEHVLATSPNSARLTDGTTFYKATTPTDTQIVGGNVANAAVDAGNPIKIGAVYRDADPSYADGQRVELRANRIGELLVGSNDIRSAVQAVTTADVGSSFTPGANSQVILSGTPTAGSFAVATGFGNSSFAVQVDGTFVGTLQFERSLDNGVTYTAINVFSAGTRFISQTITSLPGRFHGNSSSSTHIRVRATSWTSGTANISILLGHGTGTITISNAVTVIPFFTQFAAETQLTAPGTTQALDVTAFSRIHCQYVITTINTNVVVRLEGSNDGTNWSNLAQGEVDTTRTANGAYSFVITGIPLFRIRFNFVSETGGTAATIDVRFTVN